MRPLRHLHAATILAASLYTLPLLAQRPTGVSIAAITDNRTALQQAHSTRVSSQVHIKPDLVVFIGDTVIPQIAEGATWKTSFVIRNLEPTTKHCQVLFFNDNGTDMFLPIVGIGNSRAIDIILNPGGTVFFETTGASSTLIQGWASVLKDNPNDSIGGMAIFRQSIPGVEPSEAVVPIVSQFDGHFVLVFDNTGSFVTSMAIANPTLVNVVATVTIKDEFGNVIDLQSLSLPAYHHQAFAIPSYWPSTAGRRGSIEFQTNGYGIAVLGLRFNPYGSFTSFNVLENFNWVVNGS